jgi:hypothetical protein
VPRSFFAADFSVPSFFAFLFLAAGPSLSAQDPTSPGVRPSGFQNLGKVRQGEIVELFFKVQNPGRDQLVIQRIQPSCGCTATEKAPIPLAPKETRSIRVTFNSAGIEGTVHKFVELTTTDPKHPSLIYEFQAEVVPSFSVTPKMIVLEDVPRDGSRVTDILVKHDGSKGAEIAEVFSTGLAYLKAENDPNQPGTVHIHLDGALAPASSQQGSHVVLMRLKDGPMLQVPVQWRFRSHIEVSPAVIRLTADHPEVMLVLTHREGKVFQVKGGRSSHPLLECPMSSEPEASQAHVSVRWVGSWPKSPRAETLTITTTDPSQPSLDIPLVVSAE